MRIIHIEQGSDDWKQMRRSRIGASVSAALMNLHPYKDSIDVYKEMVLGEEPFINAAMKHGSDNERIARDNFNRAHLSAYLPVVVVNDQYPYLMASLDGIAEDERRIIEIKCPGDKVFAECFADKIPKYWEIQIQHQLLVTGYDFAYLYVWKNENENLIIPYQADKKIQDQIEIACTEFFEKNLLNAVQPTGNKPEYEINDDIELEALVGQWLASKEMRVSYETVEERLRLEIIAYCKDKPTKTARARIEKSETKGPIQYTKIPELAGKDLEQYRKPSTIRWRICET